MRQIAWLMAAATAGCAYMPPERIERDNRILEAIQPCREQYRYFFTSDNRISVNRDGVVRYWYHGHLVGTVPEVERCLADARKNLKIGPWAPANVVRPGPATVSITTSQRETLVPVRVNGADGTMVLRRNASLTAVNAAYAQRARLQVLAESPTFRVRGAERSIEVPFVRSRSLEVGDAVVEWLDIAIYQELPGRPAADGILGENVLGRFTVTIDRRTNRLTLERKIVREEATP